MKRHLLLLPTLAAMLACSTPAARAQGAQPPQVDMAAVQMWSKAKVARFKVIGAYDKRTEIAFNGGLYALGDVTDGLTLEFSWDLRKNAFVGAPTFQDGSSKAANFVSGGGKGCKPPKPSGGYEHFSTRKLTAEISRIKIEGTRHYPDVQVAGCEADVSYKPHPAKDVPVDEYLAVPNPMMLALPGASAGGGNVTVLPGGKGFVVKANGWTWTYTATPVP